MGEARVVRQAGETGQRPAEGVQRLKNNRADEAGVIMRRGSASLLPLLLYDSTDE